MMELTLEGDSLFVPEESSGSSGSDEKSSDAATEEPSEQYLRRKHRNRFL